MIDLLHHDSGKLKQLKKLSLKYNQLEIIPSSLSACSDIEEFNIENNLIEEIGMFQPIETQPTVFFRSRSI